MLNPTSLQAFSAQKRNVSEKVTDPIALHLLHLDKSGKPCGAVYSLDTISNEKWNGIKEKSQKWDGLDVFGTMYSSVLGHWEKWNVYAQFLLYNPFITKKVEPSYQENPKYTGVQK